MTLTPSVAIIGAGPAGLTAAYQLCKVNAGVTVLEADPVYVGGISRTARYKGFHFDIGGHRFFSKSKEVESRGCHCPRPSSTPCGSQSRRTKARSSSR
jgi:monoamine oxidase